MTISYDRSVCCDLNETIAREWLVTNGRGSYAAGTIAGMLTRMEHGLLVASLADVATPQLLFAKIDEEVVFDERTYYLGTNEYRDSTLNPSGFVHLETFRLEEGFPVFTYHIGGIDGIMLEKRIWMPQGRNTTYIQYRVLRTRSTEHTSYGRNGSTSPLRTGYGRYSEYAETAQRTLTLTLLPFAAYRPHNTPQHGRHDWHFQVQPHRTQETQHSELTEEGALLPPGVAGCTIRACDGAHPYHLLAVAHPESQTTFIPTNVWYWNFLRRQDAAAGRPAIDDLYLPGVIRTTLWPGEDATLTLILSAEELHTQLLRPRQLTLSYTRSVEAQRQLLAGGRSPRFFGDGGEAAQAYLLDPLPITGHANDENNGTDFLVQLLQAANSFIAELPARHEDALSKLSLFSTASDISVVLSEFYGLNSRTRDTLIALPGLLLTTQKYALARRLLRELARHFRQGMLPSHWPLSSSPVEAHDYDSVDITLWYFNALDAYLQATHDYALLDELYYRLTESIHWYTQGNEAGISVDARDGLLQVRPQSNVLTWMNARVNGQPITPRYGKAVEVNALWYHTLSLLVEWSQHLYRQGRLSHFPADYQQQLELCKRSFQYRFWYAEGSYLYDVVDGPQGDDKHLRPNQLLAFSLRYPVLEEQYRERVLDTVTHHLLTPYGLRTLAPHESDYIGHIELQHAEQSLHQGCVWTWLIGPYVNALLTTQSSTRTPPYTNQSFSQELVHEYVWRKGLQLLAPLQERFQDGIQGMSGGVFAGNAPHSAGYPLASALCSGELLRIYAKLAQMQTHQSSVRVLSV